jgi:hypothetical protein
MKLTEDAEVDEILKESCKQGVDIVQVSAPLDNPNYFQNADEYVFTTRSRWARYFKEAGIVPEGASYNPVDHAMRNDLEEPIIQIEENEIRAALFVRDNYETNDLEQENSFSLGIGDKIGRLGAYNREEMGVNPEHFSGNYTAERKEAQHMMPEGLTFHYDEIKDPALQPEVEDISDREGMDIARNIGVVQLGDRLLEPNHDLTKEEIKDAELSELVKQESKRPEKVGPGNYLAITEEPVTTEGF